MCHANLPKAIFGILPISISIFFKYYILVGSGILFSAHLFITLVFIKYQISILVFFNLIMSDPRLIVQVQLKKVYNKSYIVLKIISSLGIITVFWFLNRPLSWHFCLVWIKVKIIILIPYSRSTLYKVNTSLDLWPAQRELRDIQFTAPPAMHSHSHSKSHSYSHSQSEWR